MHSQLTFIIHLLDVCTKIITMDIELLAIEEGVSFCLLQDRHRGCVMNWHVALLVDCGT